MSFKKFKTLASKIRINHKFCKIIEEKVELPDGSSADWFIQKSLGAVVILPILADGQIMLQKTYKHGCGEILYEFPAGMIDPNEKPLKSAERELLEETGFKAEKLTFLGEAFANPTGSTAKHYYFLAENCKKISEPDLEPAEQIEILFFKDIQTVFEFLMKNKTANTALALLSFYERIQK